MSGNLGPSGTQFRNVPAKSQCTHMFERAKEYLKFGAGRPPGTMWAMEKAYFEFRRRFPGKEEHVYLWLALQSRYPEKNDAAIQELVSDCRSLDEAIVKAIAVGFGHHVAFQIQVNVLCTLPACSRCGKYRALSTIDNLCYGCRKFPGFAACTTCRLYWDDYPRRCRRCGGDVWRITDGPGVPIIPLNDEHDDGRSPVQQGAARSEETLDLGHESSFGNESDARAKLALHVESLDRRCAIVWDASLRQRRQYRELRRRDPQAARELLSEDLSRKDATLVADLDDFLNTLAGLYLAADADRRSEIRKLIQSKKRLLGNLKNYAGRAASKLKQTSDAEWLLRGLAAASIDDGHSCQDYGFVIGELYRNALECGLKPSEFLSVVAELSDNEMRSILENFESSKDFEVFVRPYFREE